MRSTKQQTVVKNVYQIGSGELTFEIIERIINENLKLELAPEARERIQKCRDYLDAKIASSPDPLYGITTGFGSLCNKNISLDELGALQENLIKSHACSVGEEIQPVVVKLMMLLKAHALSLGHSGVQVITGQLAARRVPRANRPRRPPTSCRSTASATSIIKARSARPSVCSTSLAGRLLS